MDILTGEGTKATATAGGGGVSMNQHQQPENNVNMGDNQSDEECPRYMLAGM